MSETKNPIIIHKFGGSCLADEDAFAKTLSIMKRFSSTKSIAVLSAFKGVTDKLIGIMESALESLESAEKSLLSLQKFHEDKGDEAL